MPPRNGAASDWLSTHRRPHVGHVRSQERLTSFAERDHNAGASHCADRRHSVLTRVGIDAARVGELGRLRLQLSLSHTL